MDLNLNTNLKVMNMYTILRAFSNQVFYSFPLGQYCKTYVQAPHTVSLTGQPISHANLIPGCDRENKTGKGPVCAQQRN